MTHRDTKRDNGMKPGDTQINKMIYYLIHTIGFNERDAYDVADALNISWTRLVFMPNDTIAFKLNHLRPEHTIKILEFLTTTYNNRGPDGKHIVSDLYWVGEDKTKLCQQ